MEDADIIFLPGRKKRHCLWSVVYTEIRKVCFLAANYKRLQANRWYQDDDYEVSSADLWCENPIRDPAEHNCC